MEHVATWAIVEEIEWKKVETTKKARGLVFFVRRSTVNSFAQRARGAKNRKKKTKAKKKLRLSFSSLSFSFFCFCFSCVCSPVFGRRASQQARLAVPQHPNQIENVPPPQGSALCRPHRPRPWRRPRCFFQALVLVCGSPRLRGEALQREPARSRDEAEVGELGGALVRSGEEKEEMRKKGRDRRFLFFALTPFFLFPIEKNENFQGTSPSSPPGLPSGSASGRSPTAG